MNFDFRIASVDASKMLDLYRAMSRSRMIEEKMLILLRQGKISKWFSGIGQEAISCGITLALNEDEYILPMHRNLGVFTSRNIPLQKLFSQWQGKAGGFTKGRDRSFHFGTTEYRIVGMISHLGPQLGIANGIALADILRGNKKVTAVFTGEGGTSEGDFHEALNVASVWKLPVLFCIENNGYGLSTPVSEQFACENLADKGKGYGMESHILDGNNIIEVYSRVKELAASLREDPRPVLLEFKTFRMRGHEEASGTKYVPKEIMDQWSLRDPIANFQDFLKQEGILAEKVEVAFRSEFSREINEALTKAFEEPEVQSSPEIELADVFQDFAFTPVLPAGELQKMRLVDAISQGLYQSMERHKEMVIMGQDIADYGGVFKITEGFAEKFGKHRVRNTPICESSIVEAAYGLSIQGLKSVVEMQFGDFVSTGFNPVVNLLAKSHFRWEQNADVVLRLPCGAGVGAGPFHSQTNEAWFTKTPGLKVVYPAFPYDAKGLMCAAIEDPNPVLFFEHKQLYRSVYQEVPESYYTLPLGRGALLRSGNEVTVVSYGAGVHWAIEILEQERVDADLIDLRTLMPLDEDIIYRSVRKTGKVIILQEDSLFGGIASDLSALITENCFEYLDAPVRRVGAPETPIPFAKKLEEQYLPKTRFRESLVNLLKY